MRYIHLPIYQKTYILVLDIYKIISKFPKEHKYSLGKKIKEISHDLLDLVIFINTQEEKLKSMEMLKYVKGTSAFFSEKFPL